MAIAVQSGGFWDCQTNSLATLPPAYSIEQIMRSGVVGSNACTKLRAKAQPGELVIVVRRLTAKERQENPIL
jgi:hypothetical protein